VIILQINITDTTAMRRSVERRKENRIAVRIFIGSLRAGKEIRKTRRYELIKEGFKKARRGNRD
jgi:hypothetical protein